MSSRLVHVTAVPARHARWPVHRDARPIGFLIEGSTRVYFAGDTALYEGMTRLAGHVDVALLPVGRWGSQRGPARLSPSTAVEAAGMKYFLFPIDPMALDRAPVDPLLKAMNDRANFPVFVHSGAGHRAAAAHTLSDQPGRQECGDDEPATARTRLRRDHPPSVRAARLIR